MSVAEQTPVAGYTGNGVTTAFSFPFTVLAEGDLGVLVDGALQTLNVAYTVSGVGGSSGTVTFTEAPANLADIVIYRDSDLTRATDYQDNGDLLAATLNRDLDRLWLALQEILGGGKVNPRTVRAPVGETLDDLPAAADRADSFLRFDTDGQPAAYAGSFDSSTALALDLASTATGKGAALVGFALTATSTARTAYAKLAESVSIDDFGAIVNSEVSASINSLALASAYTAAALLGISTVSFGSGGTYYFPPEAIISQSNFTLDCRDALLKQPAHSTDKSWLLITGHSNFKLKNFRLDANRANTPTVGADRAALLIYNCSKVEIDGFTLTAAKGKGLAVSSGSSGSGAIDVRVRNGYGDNCGTQVFIADGSTGGAVGTPSCDNVLFENLTVGSTDHAGLAINDGARHVRAINVFADVNNATWDAIGVRGARDVQIIGCTGRRGRNGIQISTLDAAAIARGEEAIDVHLSGNTWELNQQSGCLVAGAIDVTISGDTAKNNSQSSASTYRGFHVTQVAGVRRSSRVRLNSCVAKDDQTSATQKYGIDLSACDDVKVIDPVMSGNITSNKVNYIAGVTDVDVIGDGADGAMRKRGSITTGTVTASANASVTFTFTTPFTITPNWAQASVFVGSATKFLKVQHIQAITTNAVQVLVSNDTATDITGTLYVEAAHIL